VTALLWIVRILIILLIIRFVLRLLFPPRTPVRRGTPAGGPVERAGGELVRDPHCGTYVPKARAIAVGSGASVTYFCSTACRDAHAEGQRAAG
jgi:hypothetical protein